MRYSNLICTYVWEGKWETCNLARSRKAHGIEVRDSEENQVFKSTDGSMVIFVKKTAISMCGRVVCRTNYKHLYLVPYPTPKPFTRQVEPKSMSTSTYVRNRDDYLYHNTLEMIKFQRVLNNDCQRRVSAC